MHYRTRLLFKKGLEVVGEIKGRPMTGDGPQRDVVEKVIIAEQALEQLTGYRVHILWEGVEEGDK